MLKYHGLDIIHKESEEDYGLPRALTLDMLQDEQYLYAPWYPIGVSFLTDLQDVLCWSFNCV